MQIFLIFLSPACTELQFMFENKNWFLLIFSEWQLFRNLKNLVTSDSERTYLKVSFKTLTVDSLILNVFTIVESEKC